MPHSLLFEPLSPPVFKWQGEFGPQARGPQAYAESRPLPLPSTIAGTIAGLLYTTKNKEPCQEEKQNNTYHSVEEGLKMLGGPRLRGPYIYIELEDQTGLQKKALCVPWGKPKSLEIYCVVTGDTLTAKIITVSQLQSIGIALDTPSKAVLEGFIYTSLSIDLFSTAKKLAKNLSKNAKPIRQGILVELHGKIDKNTLKQLNNRVASIGGEQKPFIIRVLEDTTPALEIAQKTLSQNPDCPYWHIASPILLCKNKPSEKEKEQAWLHPQKALNQLVDLINTSTKLNTAICENNKIHKNTSRLVFSAIGLGYDACKNTKRKYCKAVMQGAGLRLRVPQNSWKELYIKGVGSFSSLGWGTLLPLPNPPQPAKHAER